MTKTHFNKRRITTDFLIRGVFFLSLVLLPMSAYALAAGDKAPAFHAKTIDGREISYGVNLKERKPVYLIFWTTW